MPKRNCADGGMSHEPSGGRGVTKDMAVAVLADYVCSNPLQDENETHERMFLCTDMGRCRVQRENLCACFSQSIDRRPSFFFEIHKPLCRKTSR